MNFVKARNVVIGGALAALTLASGCVADRPSRNGVFNENQYLRKDFLVRPGNSQTADPGWFMKGTILSTTTPNPLAPMGLYTGTENGGAYVRFNVTQDKLQMVNVRELSDLTQLSPDAPDQGTRDAEVMNAWPVTNVDLKYRVNLDGEKTNFYEENQELDWKIRQWVKVNFSKNDMSDLEPFGSFASDVLAKCADAADASATLVPDSLLVEENDSDHTKDYFSFKVQVTVPISFSDITCVDQFGDQGQTFQRLGRHNITMTLMYSFVRASANPTYLPLVIAEKDPIRKKYGTIDIATPARDPSTGLLTTRALAIRYDPAKPIVYYFAKGYPKDYKGIWTDAGGIVDQTNALLKDAGAAAQLSVRNFDDPTDLGNAPPREYGDVRYSFIRWVSDLDSGAFPVLAQEQPTVDPRTGEAISTSINVYDWVWKDFLLARLDFYLQQAGAECLDAAGNFDDNNSQKPFCKPPPSCKDGDTIPLVPDQVKNTHNASSTLYAKMQQYLGKPSSTFGFLGPADFIVKQDSDFYKAFFTILPFQTYADPAANQYVIPEGGTGTYGPPQQLQAMDADTQWHSLMGQLDRGWAPYDVNDSQNGINNALEFLHSMKKLTLAHRDYAYMRRFRYPTRFEDDVTMHSYLDLFQRDARHCVNGQWETRQQYTTALIKSYYAQTVWHEFGHALGLNHNFMASIDRANFPHYKDAQGRDHIGMYSSSVMEYNSTPDRVFWANTTGKPGWAPYDQGAISFVYANSAADAKSQDASSSKGVRGNSVSGQSGKAIDGSGTAVNAQNAPWKDPHGFADANTETQYLNCDERHTKYTPFCRTGDFGSTPSEIIAHDIDNYEWNYLWRNFRLYHKYWNLVNYADTAGGFITDIRRFMSVWAFDWSPGEIADNLRILGVTPPQGVDAAGYYNQLALKFNTDVSMANQIVAAFHEAIIQQSSGERPFRSTFDNYFGDTTQQGIVVDKLLALQAFTALWKTDNFDPDQAQGGFISSFSNGATDAAYQSIAEQSANSMIGGQYDIFPFGIPLAVLQFSEATHDINFLSTATRPEVRDWTGGYLFNNERDFLEFFWGMAAKNGKFGCTSINDCNYDPRQPQGSLSDIAHSDTYNQFVGPNGRRYIWIYVQDRNAWVVADRDRNVAAYLIMYNYTADVIHGEDDGSTGAYSLQLPVKYFIDYFRQFN